MIVRTLAAAITDPTGIPREGLAVYFHAPAGHAPVVAMTDAGGVFRAELEAEVTYRVSVENAVIVEGLPFPAGTVFVVRVPAGEGTASAMEALVEAIDASRPALLDRIAALEARVTLLESPVAQGGDAAGSGLADAAGEVS